MGNITGQRRTRISREEGGRGKGAARARCRIGATQFGVGKPTIVAHEINIPLPSNVQEMGRFFFSLFLLFLLKDACVAYPF